MFLWLARSHDAYSRGLPAPRGGLPQHALLPSVPLLATGGILQQDADSEVLTLGGPGHKVMATAEGTETAKEEAEAATAPWPPTRTQSRRHPREGRHSATCRHNRPHHPPPPGQGFKKWEIFF